MAFDPEKLQYFKVASPQQLLLQDIALRISEAVDSYRNYITALITRKNIRKATRNFISAFASLYIATKYLIPQQIRSDKENKKLFKKLDSLFKLGNSKETVDINELPQLFDRYLSLLNKVGIFELKKVEKDFTQLFRDSI